jgi:predicted regulator of Ras-like GTPase activity (Roadblock/LC7/MglB family)
MERPAPPIEQTHESATFPPASPSTSRARAFRTTLASLSTLAGVQGGLIVTPDGLVITSELPSRYAVEALGALGATLGRELELGAERLGRGVFRTALFASSDGALFVGGSPVGFLLLVGDGNIDTSAVLTALDQALHHLG